MQKTETIVAVVAEHQAAESALKCGTLEEIGRAKDILSAINPLRLDMRRDSVL